MGLRLGLIPPQGITRVSATDDGFRPPSVLACSSLPGGRAGLLHSSLPTVFDARKDRGSVVRARSNSGYYWQTQAEFYPTPPPFFFYPPCQFRPGPIAPSSGGEASCNYVMQRGGGCCSGACRSLSFNRCNWHWDVHAGHAHWPVKTKNKIYDCQIYRCQLEWFVLSVWNFMETSQRLAARAPSQALDVFCFFQYYITHYTINTT